MTLLSHPIVIEQKSQSVSVELVQPVTNGTAVIRLTTRKAGSKREEVQEYLLDPMPSGFGRAFILTKKEMPLDVSEDRAYHVCVENQQDFYCDCKGFDFSGACKHSLAVRELLSREEV